MRAEAIVRIEITVDRAQEVLNELINLPGLTSSPALNELYNVISIETGLDGEVKDDDKDDDEVPF
jgi:hypothetical protein